MLDVKRAFTKRWTPAEWWAGPVVGASTAAKAAVSALKVRGCCGLSLVVCDPQLDPERTTARATVEFVDRLPRKAISYLVYSTAEITPERALSFGIVSDVV